ncbi:MAG: protein kinase [Verrucomicrobia subdivision 3 bacterium]|nr:protein kinase [Limisphaerales bacterium]
MASERISSEMQKFEAETGYQYVRKIASGGYGHVYLFARKGKNQPEYVAAKFVYREIFGPPDDRGSASAYQRALEGLQNFRSVSTESQYLLRIFDVHQRHDDGYFCYMMELADDVVSGRSITPGVYRPRTLLHELERNGRRERLPANRCVEVAITLARGLQILHESGFTHRDLRPANIIFVDEMPKLADIDLLAGDDAALPSYIPTHYAAPEGCHSSRADIFSLGKTLYEMCTGFPVQSYPCLPFNLRHWDDHQIMLQLNRIIAKACARTLRERYGSAKSMLNDLERITWTAG